MFNILVRVKYYTFLVTNLAHSSSSLLGVKETPSPRAMSASRGTRSVHMAATGARSAGARRSRTPSQHSLASTSSAHEAHHRPVESRAVPNPAGRGPRSRERAAILRYSWCWRRAGAGAVTGATFVSARSHPVMRRDARNYMLRNPLRCWRSHEWRFRSDVLSTLIFMYI